jgi:hypothetical protein
MKRISGNKRGEMTGSWRKLHNEDFVNSTFHQIVLVGNSEGETSGKT